MRFLLFFCILFTSCQFPSQKPSSQDKKPLVLVSIPPYASFVKKIVGEKVHVKTVVPEGIDAHTYEPTPKSLQDLEKAEIWFQIGDPFEEKVLRSLKQKNPDLEVHDLREQVPLLYDKSPCSHCNHHGHDHHTHSLEDFADVHVWMNPKLALQQSAFIQEVLEARYNQSFSRGFSALEKAFLDLDDSLRTLLFKPKAAAFVTSHPSFAYFCEEYGLIQISLEIEGKEARAKDVEIALRRARTNHAAVALIEPQFSPKSAIMVAKELDIPVKMVDPYSPKYFKSLLHLANVLHDPHSS
ncbi:MAG: zinc ABC transporter substrate-binding protein [Chlamydiota bacterium]